MERPLFFTIQIELRYGANQPFSSPEMTKNKQGLEETYAKICPR